VLVEADTKLVAASSGIDEMDSTTEAEVVAATALVVTPAAQNELEARNGGRGGGHSA
jgi:hypothetical protein